jgi:hypothetical protein
MWHAQGKHAYKILVGKPKGKRNINGIVLLKYKL